MPKSSSRQRRAAQAIPSFRYIPLLITAGGAIAVLAALSYWSGATANLVFISGVAAFMALLALLGLALWWLLLSPLPATQAAARGPSPVAHWLAAGLATISGLLFVAGNHWDESWRRLYTSDAAIDDAAWLPNLLFYIGLGLNGLLALGIFVYTARGTGSVREKLRRDPLLSMLAFAAAVTLLALPFNVVWHGIYGPDLTAWSPASLLVAASTAFTMVAAAAVQLWLLPRRSAWEIHRLPVTEIHFILLLAIGVSLLLHMGVGEWELVASPDMAMDGSTPFLQAFLARPEWLYPAIIVAVTLFFGNVALHALRRPGAAILVTLAALFFRALFIFIFQQLDGPFSVTAVGQFMALIPAAALDMVYVFRIYAAGTPGTRLTANLFAVTAMMTLGLWLLPRWLAHPQVDAATIPAMVAATLVAGLWSGWCGAAVGQWLHQAQRRS
ncbi:MAG: hypothetical protein H3C34_12120 [Caldilineaceae bacterium]|nr:hypothetical protein [Caldilineaceae bacterium]